MNCRFLLVIAAAACSLTGASASEPGAGMFGFSGPETFPIDHQIAQIRAADIDGDGLRDIVIVNNARSKINLLINQTGKTNAPAAAPGRRELNELPPDARFRIQSIASEKRIAAFAVADLNNDQRPDLAYYGEPKELVVQLNQGTNGWAAPQRWPIEDGVLSPNGLAIGDLNGDELPDLLLLGENQMYLLAQEKDGGLAEPEKIPFSGLVRSVQILDVNGDGREDLLLVNWDTPNPIRVRLQTEGGHLGPEIHFEMPPIRSYWADDLDHDRKTELITIAQNSGRSQIANFALRDAAKLSGEFAAGQFQIMPLNRTSKARRGMAWADVNADKRLDLIVAEPESGQVTVFLQEAEGRLNAGETYATLTGVSELAAGDWDADGRAEIFLLSSDERAVGVTAFDQQGKVAFPSPLPLDGKPLSMALGRAAGQGPLTLAVILDVDGKRSLVTRRSDGTTKSQTLSDSFKSNPSSMSWHDVDQDGLSDLVVLIPYEKIKILLQHRDSTFNEIDVQAPGGSLDQPWLARADVDGDGKIELLLPQRNFIRAVVLKHDAENADNTNRAWSFSVKDQINGTANNSRLVGATAIRNGSNAVASLFLLDAERKVVSLSERGTNGVWQIVRNISLPLTDFFELQPVAFGQAKRRAVGFLGLNAVAWLPLYGQTWEVSELDGYETSIRDGRLNDVVSGDLNQDGRKDLVYLETARNHLDLVIFDENRKLVPANRWPVFEERSFRSRRVDSQEPREAVIADFTGDGRNDLAIIVHDRVIVYPQEQ